MIVQPEAADPVGAFLLDHLGGGEGVRFVGLCGAQGSGKSTVADIVATRLAADGVRCAVLALDDLYLGKAERVRLAAEVHPLMAVRGPPGTHDIPLALAIFAAIRAGRPVAVPVFDKLADDRLPRDRWRTLEPPLDLMLFEGWCVGAIPQDAPALDAPVNGLEAAQDADGAWRRYVNDQLAGPYQALFRQLDALILLKAPAFEIVQAWRSQQEAQNARTHKGSGRPMSEAEVGRFIQYYERLTRHMLAEMPSRADLVVALDEERQVAEVRRGPA